MKNLVITIFVLLVIVILGSLLFFFQVRETESVLITKFGKPVAEITEPGWYLRWPAPIQRVYKFDSRMRVFEAKLGETPTKGAVPIIVDTYIVWKIEKPLKFFNAVKTVKEAENALLSRLRDTRNSVIGRHSFSEFVNSDPSKIKLDEIQKEMRDVLQLSVAEDYGIEIKTLGIKQLKISKDISESVFERMRAERNRRTEAIVTQGTAEATKIESDANLKKTVLLAAAEARAKEIRGAGDAEAAKHYKLLKADIELAMFLRNIETLKKILEKRATIIISPDTQPFKLLKEMPNLNPKTESP